MDEFQLTSPAKIKLSENDVEGAVLQFLMLRHYYPLRQQSGLFKTSSRPARFIRIGEPGIPDYCIPAFFVEVKAPGKKLSDVQRDKIWTLENHWGIHTAVISSLSEMMRWLDDHPIL